MHEISKNKPLIETVISVDLSKVLEEQPNHGVHNRWHPDIIPVATVKQGQVFRVECLDWTGGQIKNDDCADDIRDADFSRGHALSGPIYVEGSEPGDYLEVEILQVEPLSGHEWGYSGINDINNGGGFLDSHFRRAAKTIWNFEGIYAHSRHIPGLRFPGMAHPGVIGTAPSRELLEVWNQRERDLEQRIKFADAKDSVTPPPPPLAYLPNSAGACMGLLEKTNPIMARHAAQCAARTIPPRENGGNVDIKNLSKGSKVWLPVNVTGANLSVGDLHFSQGDGEITFCGAIEMAGSVTMKVNIIKQGVSLLGNLSMPMFMSGPVEPRFSKYLTFEGISVDEKGKQYYLDTNVAYKQAVLNCITYMKRFGYTAEQVYILLSCCPCEGRISSVVDKPNACCSLAIPTEIFDFDITPKSGNHSVVETSGCPVSARLQN